MPGTSGPADVRARSEQLLRPELADLAAYVPARIRRASRCGSTRTRRRRLRPRCARRWRARSRACRSSAIRIRARLRLKEAIATRTGAPVSTISLVGTGSDEVIALVATALRAAARASSAGHRSHADADVRDVPGHGARARHSSPSRCRSTRRGISIVGDDEARDRADAAERRLRREAEQPDGQSRLARPARGVDRRREGLARRDRRGVRRLHEGRIASRAGANDTRTSRCFAR